MIINLIYYYKELLHLQIYVFWDIIDTDYNRHSLSIQMIFLKKKLMMTLIVTYAKQLMVATVVEVTFNVNLEVAYH